jgi:hypothetical protein
MKQATVECREVAKRDTDPFKPFLRTSKQKEILKINYTRNRTKV